jgi:hypothetical protein
MSTAYENWMRRMDNPDFDPDAIRGIYVPGTQRSRIPVPVERGAYELPSRIPAQQQSFSTSQKDMGYANGRQQAPRRYQPYSIPVPMSKRPKNCQCPIHCPKRGSSRVPIYQNYFAPSSSGMWHVCSRSGIASTAPRGILKTADGRRRHPYQ